MWNEHRLVCACRFVYPLNGLHIAMRRLFHSILFNKGFPLSLQFPSFKNRIRLFHFIPLRYISFQSWSMKDFIPLRCIYLSVPLSSIKRISAIATEVFYGDFIPLRYIHPRFAYARMRGVHPTHFTLKGRNITRTRMTYVGRPARQQQLHRGTILHFHRENV